MKKIWTMTTIKNEEDIIESFVRYHLNIVDGMVICNNCSSDNTGTILERLKAEGLNIDILTDTDEYFDQVVKRNELLKYTTEKYKPDYIFPIDADEFICSYGQGNPREEILKLSQNTFYYYRMVNYVLFKENKELFIPKKIIYQRECNEEANHNFKVIIPKKIYLKGISLIMGCHSIEFLNAKQANSLYSDSLYLAHFPVRSSEQLMNRVIIGRLNNSSLHSREEGLGFHQYLILDEIIKCGKISRDKLEEISKYYGILDKKTVKRLIKKPINLKFCSKKSIEIIYNFNSTNKVLINTIKNSLSIINHMRENNFNLNKSIENINMSLIDHQNIIEDQNNVINSLGTQIEDQNNLLNDKKIKLDNLEKRLQDSKEIIKNKDQLLTDIFQSKSWILISKMRKLLNKLKISKN